MLCKYNGLGAWAVQTGRADSSVVVFIPGPNTISDQDYDAIKTHPEFVKRVKEGKLEILVDAIKPADKDASATEIGSLSVKKAQSLVAETFNTVELNKWKEDETRPGVLKAIEDQLAVIEKERSESKTGDDKQE